LPLIACAPLAVAKEKGFFAKHGLDQVTLVRESNWRGITDGIAGGYQMRLKCHLECQYG
jgi:bicarbonate transport system ATP-binding protein